MGAPDKHIGRGRRGYHFCLYTYLPGRGHWYCEGRCEAGEGSNHWVHLGEGKLVCGASLEEAIKTVDKATKDQGKPLFYAINCTHVSDFLPLFENKKDKPWMERLVEVMANPSTKSHTELDATTKLDAGDPAEFARLYVRLRRVRPSFRIFGGCCGSSHEHLGQVAKALCKLK